MFYIMSKTNYEQLLQSHIATAHWIELPDGNILARLGFTHASRQDEVEAHADVVTLPHPMSGESVGPAIAAKLAHIGVIESHRTYDVAKLASKIHPQMRLR